jgi:hypothetical protein
MSLSRRWREFDVLFPNGFLPAEAIPEGRLTGLLEPGILSIQGGVVSKRGRLEISRPQGVLLRCR